MHIQSSNYWRWWWWCKWFQIKSNRTMATVCKMQMQSFNRTVNANDIFVENGNRLVLSMRTCWNLHHTPLRVVKQWNLSKTLIRITHVPPFNWNELKNYQLLLLKPTHNANTQKVVSFWSVLKGYRITFYDTFDETFSPRDQLLCQPFPYIFVHDGNSLILIISISHSPLHFAWHFSSLLLSSLWWTLSFPEIFNIQEVIFIARKMQTRDSTSAFARWWRRKWQRHQVIVHLMKLFICSQVDPLAFGTQHCTFSRIKYR